jgi:hypothetical protein
LPCIAFGHPSCELALRCVRAPNLGEAILKNLPPSQNWFLSILRLVFFPSAPLCGHFHYGSSCVWAPILRTGLELCLGTHLANLPWVAFGRPYCKLTLGCVWAPTLHCVWVPNLGEAILKNLPPSQNWFLSILWLVFLPSAPLCGRFRVGVRSLELYYIYIYIYIYII